MAGRRPGAGPFHLRQRGNPVVPAIGQMKEGPKPLRSRASRCDGSGGLPGLATGEAKDPERDGQQRQCGRQRDGRGGERRGDAHRRVNGFGPVDGERVAPGEGAPRQARAAEGLAAGRNDGAEGRQGRRGQAEPDLADARVMRARPADGSSGRAFWRATSSCEAARGRRLSPALPLGLYLRKKILAVRRAGC